VIPVKDDIPTDRAPVVTVVLLVAFAAAGIAFGGGILPWVSTMLLLWYAGPSVEDAMGRGQFASFCLSTGLLGYGLWIAFHQDLEIALAVGEAIACAVAVSHVVLYPWARVIGFAIVPMFSTIVGVPLAALFGLWIVVQAAVGVFDLGQVPVASAAAGALLGLAFARLLGRHNLKTPDQLLQRGRSHAT
jgi:membrane associated rhomboid family serine protease